MKQHEVTERLSTIIELSSLGPFYWEKAQEKMFQLFERKDIQGSYSKRTFQRDLKIIRDTYGIDIRCNKRTDLYEKNIEESSSIKKNMLGIFNMVNAFQFSSELEGIVFFDDRKAEGTEHLSKLVKAIKGNSIIRFKHHKGWKKTDQFREVKPLALKEIKYSWYLIGLNEKDELRNFGLDRIFELEFAGRKFTRPPDLNLKSYYNNVFGILNDKNLPVETIQLSFTIEQGNYIKSMPIHPSQEIIEENEERLLIGLKLKINHELISEILSYGNQVKVIKPESLKKRIVEISNNVVKTNKLNPLKT